MRRLVALVVVLLSIIHIGLNLFFTLAFGNNPCLPGDIIKLSSNTVTDVFWGRFYAYGDGTFVLQESESLEVRSATWIVVARDPPIGMWEEEISSRQSNPSMQKGTINVNIQVPSIQTATRIPVEGHIVINGYVPKQIDETHFTNELIEMQSEPVRLTIYPKELKWLIRQNDWVLLSLFTALLASLFLIKTKSKMT